MGYSQWGHRELDTTEQLSTRAHTELKECWLRTQTAWVYILARPFTSERANLPGPRLLHLQNGNVILAAAS